MRLVTRDLANRTIVMAPSFGYPDNGQGPPALSPDRRYVAIQATRPTSEAADVAIFVVDLLMNAAIALTDSMPGNQIAPRWTPDGQAVLFSSDAGGSWNIWSVPISGGEPRMRLRLDAGSPVFFDVSLPDGRLVVELTTPGGRGSDLWEASVDTGIVRRITATPERSKFMPRVSPDGQMIAYTGPPDSTEVSGVIVMPRSGGAAHLLLPRITVPSLPSVRTQSFIAAAMADSWSPNGAYVLAMWRVDATYTSGDGTSMASWFYGGDIYAASIDGTVRARLTSWPWGDAMASIR
jgi:Tol biopolymer transport system component